MLIHCFNTKPGKQSKIWPADLYAESSSAMPSFNLIKFKTLQAFLVLINKETKYDLGRG